MAGQPLSPLLRALTKPPRAPVAVPNAARTPRVAAPPQPRATPPHWNDAVNLVHQAADYAPAGTPAQKAHYRASVLADPRLQGLDKASLGAIFDARATAHFSHLGNATNGGIAGRFFSDLYHAAVGLPFGVEQAAVSGYHDVGAIVHGHTPKSLYTKVLKPTAQGVVESVEHPLRHPGLTFLNALGAEGAIGGLAGRVGAVGAAARGADIAEHVGQLVKADKRAYRVLANPDKHLPTIDRPTAERIANPSPSLLKLVAQDDHLAATRKTVLREIGNGHITPRELAPHEKPGAAARAVGASKPGRVAQAAIRTPRPKQRTLTVPGKGGAPGLRVSGGLGSKNYLVNAAQRNLVDRARQRSLDKGTATPLEVQGLTRLAAEHLSATTKVGREMRAERAVLDALEQAPASRLERFGKSRPARLVGFATRGRVDAATLRGSLRGAQLTAAEQKAIDITASGRSPAEHIAYHENQLARKIGTAADQRKQIALVKAAIPHLESPSKHLQAALPETATVIGKREQLLGFTPDEIAHRIGARSAEIAAGAAGHESPLQEIHRIEGLLGGAEAPKDVAGSLAKAQAALEQNLARQQELTHPRPVAPPGVETTYPPGTLFHGSPEGPVAQIDPFRHTQPWREGIGFYVTESKAKAQEYAAGRTARGERKAGASVKGSISPVFMDKGARVLDYGKPADLSFWRSLAARLGFSEHDFNQYVLPYVGKDPTNATIRDELLVQLREEHGSEAVYALEEALHEQGIQATTHMEGLKAGTPHRVWVVKDPAILQHVPPEAITTRTASPTVIAKTATKTPNLNPLRRQESQLRDRIATLVGHQRVQEIHQGLIHEGHLAQDRGAFYLPAKTLVEAHRVGPGSKRPGVFGLNLTQKRLPSVTHAYTGALHRTGNFRTDATGLAATAYREAQRYASVQRGLDQIKQVAKNSEAEAGGKQFAVPVRTTAKVPESLRRLILEADQGTLTTAELRQLPRKDVETLVRSFFPDPTELTSADLKGVQWVDRRLLARLTDTRSPEQSGLGRAADAINAPFRAGLLYTKPAYALNLLQNLGTAVIQQGVFTPLNITRALRLGRALGPDDQHAIFALMGEGLTRSLEATAGVGKKAIHEAGSVWNTVVDRYPRVASWLHEARREGFNTPETIHALLTDPTLRPKLVEITRRANREAIDYASLTPFERNVVKRALFFYPWLHGATIYSLRFPIEHPIQAAIAGQLGERGHEQARKILGRVPSYLEGAFPMAGGLVNPANVNTFSTPADLGQALAGPFTAGSTHAGDLAQNLSPALAAVYGLISGKTTLGQDLPTGQSRVSAVAENLLGSQPLVRLAQAAFGTPRQPAKNPAKQPIIKPTLENTVGRYGAGGMFPASYNKAALNAKGETEYVAGLDPQQKVIYHWNKDYAKAVADAKRILPGGKLPPQVRGAFLLRRATQLAQLQVAKAANAKVGNLTDIQKAQALVQAAKAVEKQLPGVSHAASIVLSRVKAGEAWKTWSQRFTTVYGTGRWTAYANHHKP